MACETSGADVAEGDGAASVGEHAAVAQRLDPQPPVLAAHHAHGRGDLVLVGGLDVRVDDRAAAEVDALAGVRLADGLEHAAPRRLAVGVLPHGCGEAVDDEVEPRAALAQVLDDLPLHVVGEGVAVDGVQRAALGGGEAVRLGEVVPARRAGLVLLGGAFEADAERVGAVAEAGAERARQPVPGARPDDEHVAERRAAVGAARAVAGHRARDLDLRAHVGGAAVGMGGERDEAADARRDDLLGHGAPLPCVAAIVRAGGGAGEVRRGRGYGSGGVRKSHVGPLARLSRRSSVTSGQPSRSARATYHAS